uniref:STP1 protein n=1 Tax=Meloidogyne hapla TaxID=6305 RepID=A0A1I8BZY6_MELHA
MSVYTLTIILFYLKFIGVECMNKQNLKAYENKEIPEPSQKRQKTEDIKTILNVHEVKQIISTIYEINKYTNYERIIPDKETKIGYFENWYKRGLNNKVKEEINSESLKKRMYKSLLELCEV